MKASSFQNRQPLRKDCSIIGLNCDRQKLYEKINTRVDQMIQQGLIEETKQLLLEFPEDSPGFQALGYKQCIDYIKGRIEKEAMIELIKLLTRRFAKRQLTWFKRFENVNWIQAK